LFFFFAHFSAFLHRFDGVTRFDGVKCTAPHRLDFVPAEDKVPAEDVDSVEATRTSFTAERMSPLCGKKADNFVESKAEDIDCVERPGKAEDFVLRLFLTKKDKVLRRDKVQAVRCGAKNANVLA
jgi:hypothetical protein